MQKPFVYPNRDQLLLLPPQLDDWVTKDHFARFLVKVLELLDFAPFYEFYLGEKQSNLGRPPYSPELMVGLLFYSVSKGALSSRAVEELAYTDVGARYLTGNHQPDHACIVRFRTRHQDAIKQLFSQIILLCHQEGLVSLQNVALDSTPCAANVAPNSSIRVDNLKSSWEKSKKRAEAVIQRMVEADEEDEALQRRLKRQLKEANGRSTRIREAMDFLEKVAAVTFPDEPVDSTPEDAGTKTAQRQKARSEIGDKVKDARLAAGLTQQALADLIEVDSRRINDVERGRSAPGELLRKKLAEALKLDPKAMEMPPVEGPEKQKLLAKRVNITDRDCYVTYKPSKGFKPAYLGQVGVDSDFQIVIDAEISNKNTDQEYLSSFTKRCQDTLEKLPGVLTADTGYCSATNIKHAEGLGISYFCALPPGAGLTPNSDPALKNMRQKIETPEGKETYSARSGIVEPIFSRLSSLFGFRRLLNRGLARVEREWLEMLTVYNLTRWFSVLGTVWKA